MYQLPLKFIEVSPDVAICATRIVAIMSTKAYQARETIKAERKAGTLINGCGNRTCETCIFLDNGSVISSPYKISRLLKKIAKATERNAKGTKNVTDAKNVNVGDIDGDDELIDELIHKYDEEGPFLIEDEDDPMQDEEEIDAL